MKLRPLSLAAASLLLAVPALAQTTPSFTYAKPDDPAKPGTPPPPAVQWKAIAKGGFTMTSGNSQTTGAVAAASVSRKEGNNRLAIDANAAYGRSNVVAPVYDNAAAPTVITGIDRNNLETTNNWLVKGRYDRFFTTNNSGYAAAQAAADKIAGKSFYGGGQVGYSRQLYKNDMHLLVAELGYDYSYERYVQAGMTTPPPVSIHSARVFVGEALTLTKVTGVTASVEGLFNLNTESKALNVNTGAPGVDAFHDTRVNSKVGFTATLFGKLSIGFAITLRYDQNPAPLPIPPGTAAGVGFAPGFQPFAEKWDTLTEATLIYTFL
ncbi:MAG TPA: DUF481 domain-containing protein [Polyangia bacterium]|nr:DUF481 domain-containing protein [Polyangia bacterium]